MEYHGLHERANEHNIGAAIAAGFGATVVATILWPPLEHILNIVFIVVAAVMVIGLVGFVVWHYELYPARCPRSNGELDNLINGGPANCAVPVLNGQPLTATVPNDTTAAAYQGGEGG